MRPVGPVCKCGHALDGHWKVLGWCKRWASLKRPLVPCPCRKFELPD